MSAAEDPDGREHEGDEYISYDRRKERRLRLDFPLFHPISEEEEEVHREAKRRAECEVEREAERMLGDIYERPKGRGKAPMELEAAFMKVIKNIVANQRAMTRSLAQVADRLVIVGTLGTQAPYAAQGNSRAGSRPQSPTPHTPLLVGFLDLCFPVSREHPQQQNKY
jgi:hypothetical protein